MQRRTGGVVRHVLRVVEMQHVGDRCRHATPAHLHHVTTLRNLHVNRRPGLPGHAFTVDLWPVPVPQTLPQRLAALSLRTRLCTGALLLALPCCHALAAEPVSMVHDLQGGRGCMPGRRRKQVVQTEVTAGMSGRRSLLGRNGATLACVGVVFARGTGDRLWVVSVSLTSRQLRGTCGPMKSWSSGSTQFWRHFIAACPSHHRRRCTHAHTHG